MKKEWILILFAGWFLAGCNSNSDHAALLRSAFEASDEMLAREGFYGPKDEDYIPLYEEDLKTQFAERAIPQPYDIPGQVGSGIPTLDKFRKPLAELALIFKTVYFNTDDPILRKPEYLEVVDKIASHLKSHPKVVISVAGHCDQRASEAYNLALGTKRANHVRSCLVKKGIDPNRIHTISYGKEQPADDRSTPAAWAKNRRVEFQLFEKE